MSGYFRDNDMPISRARYDAGDNSDLRLMPQARRDAYMEETRRGTQNLGLFIMGFKIVVEDTWIFPFIASMRPREGFCSKWLDSLPKDKPIVFVELLDGPLEGMLTRRGFKKILIGESENNQAPAIMFGGMMRSSA